MIINIFLIDVQVSVTAVCGINWERDGAQSTLVVASGESSICIWIRNNREGI